MSGKPDQFVGLQAQSPLGILHTIGRCGLQVPGRVRIVLRLQEKVRKVQLREPFRLRFGFDLRIDQLQLITARLDEGGIGLGADADPVEPFRRGNRAVGLDANLESFGLEGRDQGGVELEKRFASGADNISGARRAGFGFPYGFERRDRPPRGTCRR